MKNFKSTRCVKLNLRQNSSVGFDPVLWLARTDRNPSTQKGLGQFIQDYDRLPGPYKKQLLLQKLHPSYYANLKLHNLASSGSNISIFTHIIDHLSGRKEGTLSSHLIEEYIWRLLAEENLNAAVSLIHAVLEVDRISYCVSNQTWSIVASKACELGHYGAASLVYHEVIDPITAYSDSQYNGLVNPNIPFLLYPDILARLAIIFMRNGNYTAVVGIQQYFKRFYSYFWHRTIYRNIAIAKVEAFACAGKFSDALSDFVSLAWQHRGHNVLVKGKILEHNLKYAVAQNLKERHDRIKASDDPLNDSSIEYNKYTLPGKKFNAIFDGVINIADTPYFNKLIHRNVSRVVADRSSSTEKLASFVASNHHALIKPVMAALYKDGLVFEAWAVLTQTQAAFPRLHDKIFLRGGEVFLMTFRAAKAKFESSRLTNPEVRQLGDILLACRNLCLKVSDNGWPRECRVACLQALLACPSTSRDALRQFLFEWNAEHQSFNKSSTSTLHYALNKSDYEKLVAFNVGDDLLSHVSPTFYIDL